MLRRPDIRRLLDSAPVHRLRARMTVIGGAWLRWSAALPGRLSAALARARAALPSPALTLTRVAAAAPEATVPGPLLNPLLRTATPLLALMARLPTLPPPANPDGLRHRIIAALRRFQSAARAGGVSADQMRAAHFTLCAAFDDIISHCDWGRAAGWSERSLIRTFHKTIEPDRGLMTLLDHMLTEPARHIAELELISVCMALGFEGRYRVLDDGPPAFRHVRDQLYRAIASVRGEPAAELAPAWRGLPAPRRPLAALLPPWVAASLIGALLAGCYVLLALSIGGRADRVFQTLAALLPDRPAVIAHLEPATAGPAEPAAETAPLLSARAKRYQTGLGSEIAAGMVEVVTERDIDMLRISGANAFVRAGDGLSRAGHQLVERLAVLLEREPGHLLVVGHTDDHPSLSIRLPSALALSEARARAVARVLVAHLSVPERVDLEGRADTEPLVPNTGSAGRDRNRRVEIVLPSGEARR
ncbi:MAG: type IVB secretion system protein IcmH/DotU [Rhodospirillaceae bacterium]